MINTEFAERFVHEWIEAWNSHDLKAVLSHYSDDFEMSSPFIIAFSPESGGTLRGKEAVEVFFFDGNGIVVKAVAHYS
jgi:ketosteroid isomerase-like protein